MSRASTHVIVLFVLELCCRIVNLSIFTLYQVVR
jgi:hypothetical protein